MNNLYIKTTPAFDRKAGLMTEKALEEFLDHIEKKSRGRENYIGYWRGKKNSMGKGR